MNDDIRAHYISSVNMELLEALGFDENDHVRSLTLRIRPDDLVRVVIEFNVTEKAVSKISKVIKRYTITETPKL